MEKISQPVRILAMVIVLVGAAGMLAMRMLGPAAVDDATATPIAQTTPVTKPKPKATAKTKPVKTATPTAKPKAEAKPKKATPAPAAKPAPVKPAPATPPLNAPVPESPTGFPAAVDVALRKHAVLVVSLVIPGARVDAISAAEAAAGAKLSGVGYLALNVLNESVARSLLLLPNLGVEEPRVLVLKRSGEVSLAFSGFADRETIAQAAANALQ
jgi:outer membrane biosynthesis protein TonB